MPYQNYIYRKSKLRQIENWTSKELKEKVVHHKRRNLHRNGKKIEEQAYLWCPCGENVFIVNSPPHNISFDEQGLMSLEKSYMFIKGDNANYICHFLMKKGIASMQSDSTCPGKKK